MKYTGQKSVLIFLMIMILNGCKITSINYPVSAEKGEVIEVILNVTSNIVPESSAHKGIVGVLVPEDWEVTEGEYSFEDGSGTLQLDENWKDSIEAVYPADEFEAGYKWMALISDEGYSYDDAVNIEAKVKIKTGGSDGCFNLGFLVTKATSGLISPKNLQWAPLSYPNSISVPEEGYCESAYTVESAEEWDELFDRDSGWTGADGIYSIPLNGIEKSDNDSRHLLLFSDTFVGNVDSNDRRNNTTIVNNTLAILNSNQPDKDQIKFIIKEKDGNAKTMFVPNTSEANDGEWYWLMDGIKINDTVYVFALRVEETSAAVFNFDYTGANLIKFEINENDSIVNIQQYDTPLYYYDEDTDAKYLLGQAIMPLHQESGNYSADGYIYIYGPKDVDNGKELLCGRVLPEYISDFDKYEYWDGESWSGSIEDCASITDQLSQEFSVSPLSNGKYILVFQMNNQVAYKIGDSPVGPFGTFTMVYNCPEADISEYVYTYNAKAHPSLSTGDKLLISYNVNTTDITENVNNADIYRPRFIYLTLNDTLNTSINGYDVIANSFRLEQNYPNPFNPATVIEYTIEESGVYTLKIFNLLGEEVRTLFSNAEMNAGTYSSKLDARDLSSGIYFYRLANSENQITKKMILLK